MVTFFSNVFVAIQILFCTPNFYGMTNPEFVILKKAKSRTAYKIILPIRIPFPEKITALLAEDGIWESPDFGQAKGHKEIRELFEGFKDMFTFSQHNMMNPVIEVDGNQATGIWYIMGPWTLREENKEKEKEKIQVII